MEKLRAKIKVQKTETLKEVLKGLSGNYQDEAEIVFNQTLNELESRMPEKEFVTFCESL